MKTSESIVQKLEQNAKWWEKVADHCESLCPHASDKNQQDLVFMSAVYKERADLHARVAEQLRCGEDIAPLNPNGDVQSQGRRTPSSTSGEFERPNDFAPEMLF